MNILTTNSTGNEKFGGIHTRKTEQIKNSPQHTFHIIELNSGKGYISKDNCNVYKINVADCTKGKTIFGVLGNARNYQEFNVDVERIVNQYQNTIRGVNPDVISVPGTSLSSYFLFKAARREGMLHRTLQEYAGILEKEIGNYTGDTRFILGKVGKEFVSPIALENMTYVFPSNICKKAVEEIHNLDIKKRHIVWNGVSEEFIKGGFNRKVPSNLTLGYTGRVHHVKNLPFFLNLNDNMKRTAELKIITDIVTAAAKPTGKPLLEKMVEGEIYYYAPRSKEKLKKFYETELSANVVSSFFETYCNGAVESLVCGTPTLLSDKAGASEVFEKYGLSDLTYSINDMSSFEKALDFAESIDFTIKESLTKEIYEDLCWEKVIKKYNKIIEEIASKSK